MAALFEPGSQLAAGGSFTGTLQTGHQDYGRRLRGKLEPGSVFAEHRNELVAHDLYNLLGRRERRQNFRSNSFLADVLGQLANYAEVNVSFEQGHTDFTQRIRNVFFSERAFAAEVFEYAL